MLWLPNEWQIGACFPQLAIYCYCVSRKNKAQLWPYYTVRNTNTQPHTNRFPNDRGMKLMSVTVPINAVSKFSVLYTFWAFVIHWPLVLFSPLQTFSTHWVQQHLARWSWKPGPSGPTLRSTSCRWFCVPRALVETFVRVSFGTSVINTWEPIPRSSREARDTAYNNKVIIHDLETRTIAHRTCKLYASSMVSHFTPHIKVQWSAAGTAQFNRGVHRGPWLGAFCSKSAEFWPLGFYPRSSPTISKVVGNPFTST